MEKLIEHLRAVQAFGKVVGTSPVFQKAIHSLPAVAKSGGTVLITGETGTGKELAARAIHYLSPRAAYPFVPVNCGRLLDTLLEDELFGHQPGAFTDARTQRHGLIAQAEKGTLFLDEVEALSPKAQVVLLRVLQEKKFRTLGSSREQHADVRVVAATNVPLEQLVSAGSFRADLYYRLQVLFIHLPPLRHRAEDILPLAYHFLLKHTPAGREVPQLAPEAREALVKHHWPGNVRELENAIIRGIYLSETNVIGLEDLGMPPACTPPVREVMAWPKTGSFQEMKRETVAAFERNYLMRLMHEHRGNVSHAAVAARKERRELGKLLKKHQIDPKRFYRTIRVFSD